MIHRKTLWMLEAKGRGCCALASCALEPFGDSVYSVVKLMPARDRYAVQRRAMLMFVYWEIAGGRASFNVDFVSRNLHLRAATWSADAECAQADYIAMPAMRRVTASQTVPVLTRACLRGPL